MLLRVQYRMHEFIQRWPSAEFYDGQLVPAAFIATRSSGDVPATHPPYMFINVTEGRESTAANSFRNEAEVHKVKAVVAELVHSGVQPASIGVISFYSSQVQSLKSALQQWGVGMTVSTVDGFQVRQVPAPPPRPSTVATPPSLIQVVTQSCLADLSKCRSSILQKVRCWLDVDGC
jgi:DNA polymerase alpha-associated DNA helicase A